MRIYLSSHFFDLFGFEGTEKLAKEIRTYIPNVQVYVPQENEEINDKDNNEVTAEQIYDLDTRYLLSSDIVVAYMDGVEIDSGVACEIGKFSTLIEMENCTKPGGSHRQIIGLYTDIRRNATGDARSYRNLFVKGAVLTHGFIVNTTRELIEALFEIWETQYKYCE